MRLTSKGRYAVMAMADLALHGGAERAVPLQEVARRQEISLSYLEQLFAKMRRAGLVSGVRGPGGGYRLSRAAGLVTVAEAAGDVRLRGSLPAGEHALQARGDVVLRWPVGAPLALTAEAKRFDNRLPLEEVSESGRRLNGRIGNGIQQLGLSRAYLGRHRDAIKARY